MRKYGAFFWLLVLLVTGCSSYSPESSGPLEIYTLERPAGAGARFETFSEESVLASSTEEDGSQPFQVRPALFMDSTFTVQIGIFDDHQSASSFATKNQLEDEQSGIATITVEDQQKYLLAYGIYSSESEAQLVADNIAARLEPLVSKELPKVVSLAKIKAISETVNTDSDILEID